MLTRCTINMQQNDTQGIARVGTQTAWMVGTEGHRVSVDSRYRVTHSVDSQYKGTYSECGWSVQRDIE